MKKGNFCKLALAVFLPVAAVASSWAIVDSLGSRNALYADGETMYSLLLDGDNSPFHTAAVSGEVSITNANGTTFVFKTDKCLKSGIGFVSIKKDGYFANKTEINGLSSIKISLIGSASVETFFSKDGTTYANATSSTSISSADIPSGAKFFKISCASSNGACISSISIGYSCVPSSSDTPDSSQSDDGQSSQSDSTPDGGSTEGDGYSKKATAFTSKSVDSYYAPTLGNQKVLIVPIKLKGSPTYTWTSAQLSSIEKYTFGEDEPLSLVNYYKRASLGKMNVTGEVAGTVSKMYQSDKYTESAFENATDETYEKLFDLLQSAIEWTKNSYGLNLDEYDSDDDGYIDSVHFIVNGSDQDDWGSNALWPHMSYTDYDPGTKSLPSVGTYSVSNLGHLESDGITTIHEQGHIYGLDDYYNYESQTSENYTYYQDFIGGVDMQDDNTMDWNAFSKFTAGWIEPYVLDGTKKTTTVTLRPSATSGDALLLASDWNGSAYDEYILIELFTDAGNNSYFWDDVDSDYPLNDGGIKVYHVDARLWGYNNSKTIETDGALIDDPRNSKYEYALLAASNSTGTDYGTPISSFSNYQLLHLIQRGGSNTFGKYGKKYRHTLNYTDLFQTGDTFSIGSHSGYKDYGSNFFYNKTKMNDGSTFNYGIKFVNVSSSGATLEITDFTK